MTACGAAQMHGRARIPQHRALPVGLCVSVPLPCKRTQAAAPPALLHIAQQDPMGSIPRGLSRLPEGVSARSQRSLKTKEGPCRVPGVSRKGSRRVPAFSDVPVGSQKGPQQGPRGPGSPRKIPAGFLGSQKGSKEGPSITRGPTGIPGRVSARSEGSW